jgi:hypothetical protein
VPLFDLVTAMSHELVVAHQLGDRLSETLAVQSLSETANATDALRLITVGIAEDPENKDYYTLEELQYRHFFVQVYPEPIDGHVSGLGPEAMGNPREGGLLRAHFVRQIRDTEDKTDAFNFFWDRISAIGKQLIPAAEALSEDVNKNRFQQVGRPWGPVFGARRTEGDQGAHLRAMLRFSWGDIEVE